MNFPAISLWQPYASALFLAIDGVHRLKTHETRHWAAPARLIGKRVAIHAAVRPVRQHEATDLDTALACSWGLNWRRELPRGAIIGLATLASCEAMAYDDEPGAKPAGDLDRQFGHWDQGRYAWRMEDHQILLNPIPWRGQLGFFRAPVLKL